MYNAISTQPILLSLRVERVYFFPFMRKTLNNLNVYFILISAFKIGELMCTRTNKSAKNVGIIKKNAV